MQGSRRVRAPPIYPCLPVEGKGEGPEGCPVGPNLGGRVRARVRVRVSQGPRVQAIREGRWRRRGARDES